MAGRSFVYAKGSWGGKFIYIKSNLSTWFCSFYCKPFWWKMGSRREIISAKGSNGENCTVQKALAEDNFPCKNLCRRVVFPLPREKILLIKTRFCSILIVFVCFQYHCASKSFDCAHWTQICKTIFKIEYLIFAEGTTWVSCTVQRAQEE